MPTVLKTDPDLLERLAMAAKQEFTRSELHLQRVSFILGNLPQDSTITRGQIEVALAKLEGEPVGA